MQKDCQARNLNREDAMGDFSFECHNFPVFAVYGVCRECRILSTVI